jgi:hypothetical protein
MHCPLNALSNALSTSDEKSYTAHRLFITQIQHPVMATSRPVPEMAEEEDVEGREETNGGRGGARRCPRFDRRWPLHRDMRHLAEPAAAAICRRCNTASFRVADSR